MTINNASIFCKFSKQINVKFSAEYRAPDFPWNVKYTLHFRIFQIFQILRRFSSQWIFPQIFRSRTGSADFPYCGNFPQIFRVKFSRFSARFSALRDPPDFPLIFPLARFSASPPACQVFRTKKDWIFPVLYCLDKVCIFQFAALDTFLFKHIQIFKSAFNVSSSACHSLCGI